MKYFFPESVSTTASFKNTVKYAFFDEIETTFHLRATKTKEEFIFCLKNHECICITGCPPPPPPPILKVGGGNPSAILYEFITKNKALFRKAWI